MPRSTPSWRRLGAAMSLTASLGLAAACAPAPVHVLDPAPEPAPGTGTVSADVQALLTEVARAFGTEAAATDIVSAGAGPAIAASELADALELGDQPTAVAAALAHAWSASGGARQVNVEVLTAEVVGAYRGDPVARLQVDLEVNRAGEPSRVTTIAYLAAWDGGELTLLVPAQDERGRPVVDSGTGLNSATGAARRFLQLLDRGNWAAIAELSDAQNTDRTELEVLRSVVEDAARIEIVEIIPPPPAEDTGGEAQAPHTVYAVAGTHQVVGRFAVSVDEREVVYERTD
ncbi:hypothetical protein IM660_14850 [Ruania alkalisoli]|uniref:DUF3887 domain-containing protein n=1 Tax=Ruania alkalisoli TaxID=2779775 RepID=A0A7M1SSF1_9MICO|nr:hypothetical protein [Ruania alkalisoli]QOR69914.1 hypothetical protein IM660_14850 [Ruania alkalisoli]